MVQYWLMEIKLQIYLIYEQILWCLVEHHLFMLSNKFI